MEKRDQKELYLPFYTVCKFVVYNTEPQVAMTVDVVKVSLRLV